MITHQTRQAAGRGRSGLAFAALSSVLVASLALGACGSAPGDDAVDGGDDSTPGASGPIAVEDLCPIFTKDLCRYLIECGGYQYQSVDDCVVEQDCYGLTQLEQSAQDGSVIYDPDKVGACHDRFSESPCDFASFFFAPDIYEVLAYCPGTLSPQLDSGDSCVSDGECKEGLYCFKPDYQCPGTCEAPRTDGATCPSGAQCADGFRCNDGLCAAVAKAGDSCVTESCSYSVSCKKGEICDGNIWCNADKICEAGRGVGEACGPPDGPFSPKANCAVGLYCDSLETFGPGLCQAPSAEGGTCTSDSDSCQDGLHCLGTKVDDQPARGTCAPPSARDGDCRFDGDCQDELTCVGGVCGDAVGVGSECSFLDNDCAEGLICKDNACAEPVYFGDDCSDKISCGFGRCVDAKCVPSLRVGETCASNPDCSSNHCVDGKCYDSSVCRAPEP